MQCDTSFPKLTCPHKTPMLCQSHTTEHMKVHQFLHSCCFLEINAPLRKPQTLQKSCLEWFCPSDCPKFGGWQICLDNCKKFSSSRGSWGFFKWNAGDLWLWAMEGLGHANHSALHANRLCIPLISILPECNL